MFEEFNEIMTIKDLQSALNIGKSLAYKMINNGEIKHIKVGNRIRIPKKFLFEYIDNRCYNNSKIIDDSSCQNKEVMN